MTLKPLEKSKRLNLYQQVADRIESLIAEKTLQPGDRIPSVRRMHQQMNVSISTVLEAYRLLEDRGLVEARPQSGYFVKPSPLQDREEPNLSAPSQQSLPIDTSLAVRINMALRNPNIIRLGAAVPAPELFPVKALNRIMGQVMRQYPEACHGYGPLSGCEPLRHEVARRLMDAGCTVTPEQILITNGTTEGVSLCLRAVTKPGDTVVIESPAYYGILEILASLHLQAIELPTHPRNGIVLSALEQVLEQGNIAACVVVSNFSNPIGCCMNNQDKQQLVQILERYQVPLVEDDVYGELYFQGNRPKAIKAFDQQGLVLYCSSCSKTLSSGLRVGWTIPGPYQNQVERLKLVTNMSTATVNQLAIAAFLGNGGYDRHLRQLRRAYQDQVMRTTQAIYRYFPISAKVSRPQGGHVLWVEFPPEFDSVALYDLAYQHNISIAPGSMFSVSAGYRNCFRLNCGLPWSDELEQAIKTLGELIDQLYRSDSRSLNSF